MQCGNVAKWKYVDQQNGNTQYATPHRGEVGRVDGPRIISVLEHALCFIDIHTTHSTHFTTWV